MKIDAVFSGGGVKAYAFIGALESLEAKSLRIERVAGTSAGAIFASLLAAGFSLEEIKQKLQGLDLRRFLDAPKLTSIIPGSKWLFLYFQMGLYHGRKLEQWIRELLAEKGVYTFADLKEDYLKVVVSDLTLGKLVVLPDDLYRVYGIDAKYFPVSEAVRMSAGFPYFFMPSKLHGTKKEASFVVDGGLLSNFPLWIFENNNKQKKPYQRPVLGIKLSESVENPRPKKIKNAIDMFLALFSTMKQAHDARYISKSDQHNIVFIPVQGVETTNFHISESSIEQLINLGKEHTEIFLKRWPS